MNEEYIDTVKHLIEQKDADKVKELLIDLHPADIAELCNDLNAEGARFIYRLLDNETAADVLVEMDEDARKELLEMDMRKNFFLLVLVKFTHQVYGVIRIHIVDKAFGDSLSLAR